MKQKSKIFVAGHKGLVGSSILRKLEKEGYNNIITRTMEELNLLNQQKTLDFFNKEKPEYVFLAAAKVGGILANKTYPGKFIYENLQIQCNVIHTAYLNGVKKLLFLGSSCIYPKFSQQPIREDYLLTSSLEPTNEAYALAKISGLKMCQFYRQQYGCDFISAMPTNLYGPGDNFDLNTSHVLAALIRKFHDAKMNNAKVVLWGTGKPKREFLFIDDLADALFFLMQNYTGEQHVNIGTGKDISILELAELIKSIVGFEGEVVWDNSKPDGTPRKLLNIAKLNDLGWQHSVSLSEGIQLTYDWFVKHNKR